MSRAQPYQASDYCGAKPPAGYAPTSVCLSRVGHEGLHRNMDQVVWGEDGEFIRSQCTGITVDGLQCERSRGITWTLPANEPRCWQHATQLKVIPRG